MPSPTRSLALLLPPLLSLAAPSAQERPRARALGIRIGELTTGAHNAITDVSGVRVGHCTVDDGDRVHTGVTVVLPHGGNLFRSRVPAAIHVANGFGKLVGSTQVRELGELESPIALTNTLNVGKVMDALVGHQLELEGNERVRSVNVVVGETNDGRLNDIRGRHVSTEHVERALSEAESGPVAEGSVGAGRGTVCFGFKGGIGSSSRRVGDWTIGVLVQSNFDGDLRIAGRRLAAPKTEQRDDGKEVPEDGSCMIVVATDAPLGPRALDRLAKRALVGMARVGASFSNGSGDYVIAFSTADSMRRAPGERRLSASELPNAQLTPLFKAVADATEESILNSLLRATAVEHPSRRIDPLPVERVRRTLRR